MTGRTLMARSSDGYTFTITSYDKGYRLSVCPENRYNGTQSFDGWFPRFYTRPQSAKSALTRFLGESLVWVDL
ncbi:hypothetical protein C1N60_23215 (plasmid) [Pantoea sp. SGAir0184]